MRWVIPSAVLVLAVAGRAGAQHKFAVITGVDAEKGTVQYKSVGGKDRDTEFTARLTKDCVIKEGYYRLGKPATTKEGDDIADGLKNPIFKKASEKEPVRVNLYLAAEDDPDKGIKKGDVVKILVNPPLKKP